jgi:hypothetical protein
MRAAAPPQQRLLDTAFDLTREFASLPPGSVLRCFFRAARQARMAGVADGSVPEAARERARDILVRRVRDGRGARRRDALIRSMRTIGPAEERGMRLASGETGTNPATSRES